jgi:hypothetical protein
MLASGGTRRRICADPWELGHNHSRARQANGGTQRPMYADLWASGRNRSHATTAGGGIQSLTHADRRCYLQPGNRIKPGKASTRKPKICSRYPGPTLPNPYGCCICSARRPRRTYPEARVRCPERRPLQRPARRRRLRQLWAARTAPAEPARPGPESRVAAKRQVSGAA